MSTPPDFKEVASCCLTCEHFNGRMYYNCMKHKFTTDYGSICSDYKEQPIAMLRSDYLTLKKKKK